MNAPNEESRQAAPGDLPRAASKLEPSKRREIENVLDDLQNALELLRRTLRQ